MLIFDWLISPAEIRALCASLQLSCLGRDAYLTRRAMHRMLFERANVQPEAVALRFQPAQAFAPCSLEDVLRGMRGYEQVELLILGSAFDKLLPLFSTLTTRGLKPASMSIRHCFVMSEDPALLISQVSALTPFLSTNAYQGAYCTESSEHASRFLAKNQVALARCAAKDGTVHTTLFLPPQKDGLPACRIPGDELFHFYSRLLADYQDQLRPVKSVYPQPRTIASLLTLCQRDLFLEQDRACCFLRMDLCFPVLPVHIILQAVDGGARMGLTADDPLLCELVRVQQARHDNLFSKTKPTLFILTRAGLTTFARTGHMSDHLYAMRNFTPAERKAVLEPLIDALRRSDAIQLVFFKDDALVPVSSFCAYEDMGIQISANDTAYNPAENHSEVFVGLPAFDQSFRHYCENVLLPEYCMSREESLEFLLSLLQEIDAMIEA